MSSVLKQCGHWVMIFFTPIPLSISMLGIASIWKRYSFPDRRAESPVHISDGPRTATVIPARASSLAIALELALIISTEWPRTSSFGRTGMTQASAGAGRCS